MFIFYFHHAHAGQPCRRTLNVRNCSFMSTDSVPSLLTLLCLSYGCNSPSLTGRPNIARLAAQSRSCGCWSVPSHVSPRRLPTQRSGRSTVAGAGERQRLRSPWHQSIGWPLHAAHPAMHHHQQQQRRRRRPNGQMTSYAINSSQQCHDSRANRQLQSEKTLQVQGDEWLAVDILSLHDADTVTPFHFHSIN